MLPPATVTGNKRDWQDNHLPFDEQAKQRAQKRAKLDTKNGQETIAAEVLDAREQQESELVYDTAPKDLSNHHLGSAPLSGIDSLSFIASLEADNQSNNTWEPSMQYMYSHEIGRNIAVEATWLTDFAMQNTNRKSSHDPYAWTDSYGACAVSPPCMDPACDDVLPCPEQCDPSACLGDICYDDDCLTEHQIKDLCCEKPCPVESKCASFCSGADCTTLACETPHAHTSAQRASIHQNLSGSQRQHTQQDCIDPNCLTHSNCNASHDHAYANHTHRSSSHDFSFTHPQRKLNNMTPTSSSSSSRMPYSFHGLHANNFDSRSIPAHMHSLGFQWSRFLNDGDNHTGSSTPELSVTHGTTPATLSPLNSHGSQNSLSQRDNLVCRWCNITPGLASSHTVCDQIFDSAEELHQHVEKSHIDSLPREDREGNGFFCHWNACDRLMCRSFQARPKLKRHMQTHTLYKPYTCARCGVQMKTKDAMEKHERTHTGERPYECKVAGCKKIFATSTELKTHMVVHSGEKPHECPICRECFADSSNLSKHKKTHYAPRFVCPEQGCDARTKRWDQMRRHLQTQNHGPPELLTDRKAQDAYKAQLDLKFEDNGDDDSVQARSCGKA